MDLRKLINDHLRTARVMQLATCANNQPWVCTIHFYNDEEINFYWASSPTRRHSLEIEQNPKVAIAVKIHEDTASENYVIGISAEGVSELVSDNELENIGNQYLTKFGEKQENIKDILGGNNPHKFYRFKSSNIVLFDSLNFPDNPRQIYKLF